MTDSIKKGSFVKFTDIDDEGTFTHVGQVTRITKKEIEFDTGIAVLGIPASEMHMLTSIDKPKNWKKRVKVADVKTTKTVKKVKAKKTGTKRDLAFAIYADMIADGSVPARKDVIERLVTELDMTVAGASTYASMVKKG